MALQFDAQYKGGIYVKRYGDRESFPRATLTSLASDGRFLGTFTARLGAKVDVDNPQPALWTLGPIEKQRGRQEFPVLHGKNTAMTISGRHIREGAHVIVDGNRASGTVTCDGETVKVELASLPTVGTHFLQVQNPDGLFSNDFIFHVAENATSAGAMPHRKMGEVLRESKLDRLVGTWVDEGTKGVAFKATFAWKIKDRVIEITTKEGSKESVALMGVNAKNGEVFHLGADSDGGSSLGKWTVNEDGSAGS